MEVINMDNFQDFGFFLVLFVILLWGLYSSVFPKSALNLVLKHDSLMNPLEPINKKLGINRNTKTNQVMIQISGVGLVLLVMYISYKLL
jgi:hypothetical protein